MVVGGVEWVMCLRMNGWSGDAMNKELPELMVQILEKQKAHEEECRQMARRALSQGFTFQANELLHIANMSEIRREHFMNMWVIENHE